MIRAVTFDFWDVLLHDDSDEPKRASRGLPTKAIAREKIFVDLVSSAHPDLDERRIVRAWQQSLAWFDRRWKSDHVTPTLHERLAKGFRELDIRAPVGTDAAVTRLARMEVDEERPDLVEGVRECLEALSGQVRIGIVSDATTSPGRALRTLLAEEGLLPFFDHSSFSDEVGAAKPSERIFRHACHGLDCDPSELVHIGDKEAHDIDGARAFGARSVLFTGAVDRGSADTRADAVCSRLIDLPEILERL